jgi:hypothetical protein
VTISQKIFIGCFAALLWLAALALHHFYPDIDIGQVTGMCMSALVGLGVSHLGSSDAPAGSAQGAPAAPVAPAGQAGRSLWGYPVLLVVIALGAALLTGCTTTTASMYAGLATQAKAGIQVFDDNTLATMHDLLCAQPYSAIQRHPEMQAGIQQLCGPLANASSLDAGQLQLLMSVVGKAQAAGLLATPATPAASGSK